MPDNSPNPSAKSKELAETLAMISKSEADIKAGRVHDAKTARVMLAKKHGLPAKPANQ